MIGRVGVCSWSLKPESPADLVRKVQELGLTQVQIALGPLRDGRWKYLMVDAHEYLFDVETDAREKANMAKREPERLLAMRADWEAWAATMPGIPEDAKVHLVYGEADIPRPTG